MRITAANTVGAMLLLPVLPAGPIGNRFEHAVSPPHAEGVASRPILQARAARAESTRFDCQSGQASAGTIIAHRVVTALRMMARLKFCVAHLGLCFAMLSIVCVSLCGYISLTRRAVEPHAVEPTRVPLPVAPRGPLADSHSIRIVLPRKTDTTQVTSTPGPRSRPRPRF